jgi:hypothetical protein
VLDIGSHLGSREIRLAIPGQRQARYSAPSHCWGVQSFGECGPSDWEKEAARMMSVYQGAYLTLAATAAHDGDMGCIFPRNPALRLDLPVKARRTQRIQTRSGLVRYQASEMHSFIRSPLQRRAWVLQEFLLLNRIVHFADDQLSWQCRSSATFEDGTFSAAPQKQTSLQSRKKNELCSRRLSGLLEKQGMTHDDMQNIQWDIVEDYSSHFLPGEETSRLQLLASQSSSRRYYVMNLMRVYGEAIYT